MYFSLCTTQAITSAEVCDATDVATRYSLPLNHRPRDKAAHCPLRCLALIASRSSLRSARKAHLVADLLEEEDEAEEEEDELDRALFLPVAFAAAFAATQEDRDGNASAF